MEIVLLLCKKFITVCSFKFLLPNKITQYPAAVVIVHVYIVYAKLINVRHYNAEWH